MHILGFAGTAKNTGKTTTALHMLDLVASAGYRIALTSIGYDGENTDHITGLPKPRYVVQPGTVIATAEKCLNYGSAKLADIQPTGIHTILGEISIATVATPGNVVLAGANRKVDIHQLMEQLQNRRIEVTFLDGALNRLAAMTMVDGLILSTGAAFDNRIPVITEHARAMESLFHLPKYQGSQVLNGNKVCYLNHLGQVKEHAYGSILDEASAGTVKTWLSEKGPGMLFTPGIFDPELFQVTIKSLNAELAQKEFVFSNPLNLLSTGRPDCWQSSFNYLKERGCSVSYLSPIHLNFITVNPFYPRYLQQTASYVPEFVDKHELLESVRKVIKTTTVIDILQPPYPDPLTLSHLKRSTP